jgi:tRNA threonylcarbamoyladenosine biosynthesis protein TsaB
MMNILAFDTASAAGSAAVMSDGRILGSIMLDVGLTHSEQLLPTVDTLLKMVGRDIGDMDAVAFTQGPGSFTGLRIGFSMAKGLAVGMNKPLIPVPTLDALALNALGAHALVVPVMNARRKQAYTAIYHMDGDQCTRLTDYQAIALSALLDEVASQDKMTPVIFTGDGVDFFRDEITAALGDRVSFTGGVRRYVCADCVAMAAMERADKLSFEESLRVEPIYLRDSEAVVKWREAHPNERLED